MPIYSTSNSQRILGNVVFLSYLKNCSRWNCMVALNSTIRVLKRYFHSYMLIHQFIKINLYLFSSCFVVWLHGCSVDKCKVMFVNSVKKSFFHTLPFSFSICKAVGGRRAQGVVWGCGGTRRAAGRSGRSTWILRIWVLLREIIHQSPAARTHRERERSSPEKQRWCYYKFIYNI